MNQCFQDNPQAFQLIYEGMEDLLSSPAAAAAASAPDTHSHAILYDLSVLKDKVQHVRSLVIAAASPRAQHELVAAAVDGTAALADAVITTATSSMMFAFHQMKPYEASSQANDEVIDHAAHSSTAPIISDDTIVGFRPCDVIELDAADLLARYTHYCHICGKGFRRDANLRMHMRAHGDEYKTAAALSNPTGRGGRPTPRKYSCPEEGCRWNRRHAKFKPLKSMICAKNHYKRSHCPKMYVCNRCGRKRFSVLSDLRTHEKHCGDLRWRCSCGTSFSRKDKLMGHLALFVGHTPAMDCLNTQGVQRS